MRPPSRLPSSLARDTPVMAEEASAALALAARGQAAAFLAARARARGLASAHALAALPLALATDAAASVRSFLRRLASPGAAPFAADGGCGPRPSGADHRLALVALNVAGAVAAGGNDARHERFGAWSAHVADARPRTERPHTDGRQRWSMPLARTAEVHCES
jgi:hypothetical protein